MELWIRSQDRERLMKANQLDIFELNTDVDPRYNHFGVYVDDYLVGEYKTKERALEVLDAIQERILNLQLVELEERGIARKDVRIKPYLECVYKMPKE